MFTPIHFIQFSRRIQSERKIARRACLSGPSTQLTTWNIYFVWLEVYSIAFPRNTFCSFVCLAAWEWRKLRYTTRYFCTVHRVCKCFRRRLGTKSQTVHRGFAFSLHIFHIRSSIERYIQKHLNIDNARGKDKNRARSVSSRLHSFASINSNIFCILFVRFIPLSYIVWYDSRQAHVRKIYLSKDGDDDGDKDNGDTVRVKWECWTTTTTDSARSVALTYTARNFQPKRIIKIASTAAAPSNLIRNKFLIWF